MARSTAFCTYRLIRFCFTTVVPHCMLPIVRPIQLISFCKGIVLVNTMHDVLLIIPFMVMFMLIPTVKLFSSRVYCF